MESIPSTSSCSPPYLSDPKSDLFKRSNHEDLTFPAKKVKHEPTDDPIDNLDEFMGSDIEEDEGDDIGALSENYNISKLSSLEEANIPVTIDEFISRILRLDASCRGIGSYTEAFNIQRLLSNVTNRLFFESFDIYRLVYLPVVLYSFSKVLTKAFNQNQQALQSDPQETYQDAYVLMKEEFNSDLDFKISLFRPKQQTDGFQVGDFFFVKSKFEQNSGDNEGSYEDGCHFGIVLSSQTRVPKPEMYSIENIVLKTLTDDQRNDSVCEESIFRVRKLNALYLRNDYLLGIYKLVNSFFHILQAKSFYMLDDNPSEPHTLCANHFLNPVMVIKNSGLTMEDDLNLPELTLDTIQKAIDLVSKNDPDSSSFLAIDFANPTMYYSLLDPILKQIYANVKYLQAKSEKTPILVIGKNASRLNLLYESLNHASHFGENGVILDPSPHLEALVDKELIALYHNHIESLKKDQERQKGVDRYSKCIDYLKKDRSIDDLTAQWIVDMMRTRKEMKRKALKESKIIITDLETLCCDSQYLNIFNAKTVGDQRILCCIMLEAHLYTEPETVLLTNFGITKFILCGYTEEDLPVDEFLTHRALDRSLFHRLQLIESQSLEKSLNSSFVLFH